MKRTFLLIAATITILPIMVIAFAILQDQYYEAKFERTALKSSYSELIDDWGQPDEEIDSGERGMMLKYGGGIWDNKYLFFVNKESHQITEKFIDD